MAEITSSVGPGAAHMRDSYMTLTRQRRIYSGMILIVFVALMAAGFVVADDRNAGGFWNGLPNVLAFPSEVVSEAAAKIERLPGNLAKFFPALIETINIAAVSTLVGAMLGLALSLLSTRGLARFPRLIPLFRRIMDVMRAIPEIVIALVLIFIMGGGPVPAMIAIAFHTGGALGKLFSEVNENADLKPVEGLESVGATWIQRMGLGVIPQVAPNYLSYGLMRFEINIRASAILGFVGAGGVGYELRNAMSWGQGRFDEAAAIFLLLFGAIVFFDQLSSHYRDKLTSGEGRA
ncbi:phosphonate ABC transporter, permease protein PhnE [Rhodovulum steppense]|uniref:Phosphonate transport system permease protein n=1 Tax=Rhodovulum steppense TaxID=540251 RepID=A0A4R1YNK0_9RHOB|nr:phosphonate ABC transporter, permease protein PhnE [Rhodovulum steppense]TCM79282.1 phosphonate transport system permease protein [Rhodovulum steppense]